MNYIPYPNAKTVRSRKTRKSQRLSTFLKNKAMASVQRKAKKLAREESK